MAFFFRAWSTHESKHKKAEAQKLKDEWYIERAANILHPVCLADQRWLAGTVRAPTCNRGYTTCGCYSNQPLQYMTSHKNSRYSVQPSQTTQPNRPLLVSSEDNTCRKLNSSLSSVLLLSLGYIIHNQNFGISIFLIAKFLGYASSFFFACLPEAVKELHVLLLGYLKFSMHKKNSMIPNSSNKE